MLKSSLILMLLIVLGSFMTPEDDRVSYWESKGKDPWLAQIIHTPDDQGRDVLHINLYLSESCTTKMFYAMPLERSNHYVLTDTFGQVIEDDLEIIIKDKGVLKLEGRKFQKISETKYFDDMKRFEVKKSNR